MPGSDAGINAGIECREVMLALIRELMLELNAGIECREVMLELNAIIKCEK